MTTTPGSGGTDGPTDRSTDGAIDRAADEAALRRAAETARAHTDAVRAVARFVEDLDDLPEPSALVEFAHLLGQEEEARLARTAALADIGLDVPSLDADQE
jgi:hypothetical protein